MYWSWNTPVKQNNVLILKYWTVSYTDLGVLKIFILVLINLNVVKEVLLHSYIAYGSVRKPILSRRSKAYPADPIPSISGSLQVVTIHPQFYQALSGLSLWHAPVDHPVPPTNKAGYKQKISKITVMHHLIMMSRRIAFLD